MTSPFPPAGADLGVCRLLPLAEPAARSLADALAAEEPWKSLGYGAEGLFGYLTREDAALTRYEIREGDATAGVLCLRAPWLRGPYLELLGLLPGFRGRGLGGAAMNFFEEVAFRVGGNAWAAVSETNAGARRFYARRGYAEVAPLPGLVHPDATELLLRKRRGRG